MRRRLQMLITLGCTLMLLSACGGSNESTENTDTTNPVVTMKQQVVFTNNLEMLDMSVMADVTDESEVSASLHSFQKVDDLKILDEETLKVYTDELNTVGEEELLKRTDDLPTGDGIYTAVYVVEDAYGHKTAKEVLVVLDSQSPMVSNVEEMDREVEVEDIDAEWTTTYAEELNFTDNVDGQIAADMLTVEMTLTDEANHVYTVKAEYTDRAGNNVSATYTITLKEKEQTTASNGGGSSNGGTTTGGGSTNGGGSTLGGGTTNAGTSYDDRDGDGLADLGPTTVMNGYVVNTETARPGTAKAKLALANAGKYNIIEADGSYWILYDQGDDGTATTMLDEYLAAKGLGWTDMTGGWFDVNTTAKYMVCYGSNTFPLE